MRDSDRKRRRKEVSPAGTVISELLQDYRLAEGIRRHRVMLEWPELVGPRVAARTRPSPVQEGGVLWVRVSNSSWLHQLSFLRNELLARINERLGDPPLVTDLRLHIGQRSRSGDDQARPERPRPRQRHSQPLPPPAAGERLAEIEAETACIDDEELRAVITEARRLLNQ